MTKTKAAPKAKAKPKAAPPEPERAPTLDEQRASAVVRLRAASTDPQATQDERAASTALLRQIELEQDDTRLHHLTGLG